jgi:hypothetical protein
MKSVLVNSKYGPSRGSHTPGDIRDAFGRAVDAFVAWRQGTTAAEPEIEVREKQFTIREVCVLLWNCRDIVPGLLFDDIVQIARLAEDAPKSRTYAACARVLARAYDKDRKAAYWSAPYREQG